MKERARPAPKKRVAGFGGFPTWANAPNLPSPAVQNKWVYWAGGIRGIAPFEPFATQHTQKISGDGKSYQYPYPGGRSGPFAFRGTQGGTVKGEVHTPKTVVNFCAPPWVSFVSLEFLFPRIPASSAYHIKNLNVSLPQPGHVACNARPFSRLLSWFHSH